MSRESTYFIFKNAYAKKAKRGWGKWPRLFIAIDLHDVVIPGTYTRYNEDRKFFPGAKECLEWMTKRKDICMILYTSSYPDSIKDILGWLKDNGIVFDYINENPECQSNDLCNFSTKMYFDILLEDKAGFDGTYDWICIRDWLVENEVWDSDDKHE